MPTTYANVPMRRRLGAGLNQVTDSAKDILGMFLQSNFQDQRLAKTQNADLMKSLLEKFNTDTTALSSPEIIDKYGPDRVATQYANLKRRLPRQLQGMTGEAPDFKSLQTPVGERVANFSKELSGIDNPDNAELTPEGIKSRAASFDLPTDIEARMGDPFGKGPTSTTSMGENPDITNLIAMAGKQRQGLLSKEPKVPLKDFSSGTEQDTYTSNRDIPVAPVQAERTPAQEAQRQSAITTATQQATQNVLNDPQNIKGFATREAAATYARTAAGNNADAKTKVTTQVIEGQDDQGNVVYRVVNTSPSQAGTGGTTGMSKTAPNDQERTAYSYGSRATQAHNIMTRLEPILMQKGYLNSSTGLKLEQLNAPEQLTDPVVRQYAQALRTFINAGLGRPESGGAISADELKNYAKMSGFTPGIDATTLKQVQDARREAVKGLAVRSGNRLGGQFTTVDELQQTPSGQADINKAIKDAEAVGLKVIY